MSLVRQSGQCPSCSQPAAGRGCVPTCCHMLVTLDNGLFPLKIYAPRVSSGRANVCAINLVAAGLKLTPESAWSLCGGCTRPEEMVGRDKQGLD